MIHFVLAYHLQGAVLDQRLNFLREVAITHSDRYDFICQAEGLKCFEFDGEPSAQVR
jgi:hypothetical protein